VEQAHQILSIGFLMSLVPGNFIMQVVAFQSTKACHTKTFEKESVVTSSKTKILREHRTVIVTFHRLLVEWI
jgi:hypothetical protein